MAAEITGDFAAAGGVADMDRIRQVEDFDKLGEIVRIGVEVVPVPRLARTAMAAAIMGNAAVSVGGEEEHLVFKGVRRQRPTMAEDNRLTRAPIVEIDPCSLSSLEGRHVVLLFSPAPDLGVALYTDAVRTQQRSHIIRWSDNGSLRVKIL